MAPSYMCNKCGTDMRGGRKMHEPTDRQIKFARSISETLGICLPEVFTKQAYWEFISVNKEKFYHMQREKQGNDPAFDDVLYENYLIPCYDEVPYGY